MRDVCSFVDTIQLVPKKLQLLEDVITKILKQIVECAIFIREYTGHGFSGWNLTFYTKAFDLDMVCSQTHDTDICGYRPSYRNADAQLEGSQPVVGLLGIIIAIRN